MIMIQHFSHFYMIICGKPRQLIQRNIFDRILLIPGIALSVHLHDVSTFLLHQVVLQAVPPELFTNGSELVRFRMSEKKISVMSRIDAASICAEQLIGDLSLQKLNDIFQSVLRRQKNRVDPIRSKFGEIVQEEVSVEEKTEYMTEFVSSHKRFSFKDLLERQGSKMEVIVTFLVILEFMKAGIITIRQEKIFDDIEVESLVAA